MFLLYFCLEDIVKYFCRIIIKLWIDFTKITEIGKRSYVIELPFAIESALEFEGIIHNELQRLQRTNVSRSFLYSSSKMSSPQ